jgi:hypothetical protein
MSQLEVASNEIYAQDFTLVAGEVAPIAVANWDGSCRLLSIVRKSLGAVPGVVGVPHASVISPSAVGAGSVWLLGVYSSVATDVSVYTVYLTRQYQASPNYLQTGATIGVQFAP